MRASLFVAVAAGITLASAVPQHAAAQMASEDGRFSVEARGTAMVPTFDIRDAADVGYGGGAGIGFKVSERFRLMADVDLAKHGTDVAGVDINTYHFMAKGGVDVWESDRVVLTVNLGAGAVTFGGDLPSSETYFAINAGAKLGIQLSPSIELLISPQGDIAFSDEAVLGTDNSWVWPLGLGFRFTP